MSNTPQILFLGGHDPSGGAGLQADIETAQAHGCRAYTVVTCLTVQDSSNVFALQPQEGAAFQAQLECLLQDVRPDIVKIGLIGSLDIAQVLANTLKDIPLVIDPVLAAGGGASMANGKLLSFIRDSLLPATTLLTPNRVEARRLAGNDDTQLAAERLLQAGCAHILLTGADEAESGVVTNRLLSHGLHRDFQHPLLPYRYHGSGCTLASACACNLALGVPMATAVERALDWTWQTLRQAENPGRGQHLPNRRLNTTLAAT